MEGRSAWPGLAQGRLGGLKEGGFGRLHVGLDPGPGWDPSVGPLLLLSPHAPSPENPVPLGQGLGLGGVRSSWGNSLTVAGCPESLGALCDREREHESPPGHSPSCPPQTTLQSSNRNVQRTAR